MPKNEEKSHALPEIGRVIAYFGSTIAVETKEGAQVICHWRRNQCLPVVGDWVRFEYEATGEGGHVLGIEPRSHVLMRSQGKAEPKPIAANVDDLVIVMPPLPGFSQRHVDYYTIAATLLGIRPVLVLNKIDLMTATLRDEMNVLLSIYRRIPFPVCFVSCETGEGMAAFAEVIAGRTVVLVGPSGVGKSSLIQKLSLDEDIRIGEVSDRGAGKHTTTATRLYHTIKGGALIDSPGVRDFTLWTITPDEALRAFPEFQPYLKGCQFRDCSHRVEPGCTLQAAVREGKVSAERYQTFQLLLQKKS